MGKKQFLRYLLIIAIFCLLVGCGTQERDNPSTESTTKNQEEITTEQVTEQSTESVVDPAQPRSMEEAVSLAGYPGVSVLDMEALQKRNYYSFSMVGQHILLYDTELIFDDSHQTEEEAEGSEGGYFGDHGIVGTIYYILEYDPINHEVISEFKIEVGPFANLLCRGDSYWICDYENHEVILWQGGEIQIYTLDDMSYDGVYFGESNLFYYTDTEGNLTQCLLKYGVVGNRRTLISEGKNLYINTTLGDARTLIVDGKDAKTLEDKTWIVDSVTGKVLDCMGGIFGVSYDQFYNNQMFYHNWNDYDEYREIGWRNWQTKEHRAFQGDSELSYYWITGNQYVLASYSAYEDTTLRKTDFYLYDSEGHFLQNYTFVNEAEQENAWSINPYPLYLSSANTLVFLRNSIDDTGAQLLFWDLDELEAVGEENQLDDLMWLDTNPPKSENEKDEELELYEKKIEEDFLVDLIWGLDCPTDFDTYLAMQITNKDTVLAAMEQLDTVMSYYPEGFFEQLRFGHVHGIRIYFAGSLTGNGDNTLVAAGAFVYEEDGYLNMVVDISSSWSLPGTFSHEFSHMIDRKLADRQWQVETSVYSEEAWSSMNPEGFDYAYSYDESITDDYGKWTYCWEEDTENVYFIDDYAKSYSTEDRARIMEHAMVEYMDGGDLYTTYPNLAEKLEWYAKAIRDGFDTTGWPEYTPWESVLVAE